MCMKCEAVLAVLLATAVQARKATKLVAEPTLWDRFLSGLAGTPGQGLLPLFLSLVLLAVGWKVLAKPKVGDSKASMPAAVRQSQIEVISEKEELADSEVFEARVVRVSANSKATTSAKQKPQQAELVSDDLDDSDILDAQVTSASLHQRIHG